MKTFKTTYNYPYKGSIIQHEVTVSYDTKSIADMCFQSITRNGVEVLDLIQETRLSDAIWEAVYDDLAGYLINENIPFRTNYPKPYPSLEYCHE